MPKGDRSIDDGGCDTVVESVAEFFENPKKGTSPFGICGD